MAGEVVVKVRGGRKEVNLFEEYGVTGAEAEMGEG